MPTYQYACNACGHQFDKVQSFTDAALTECPECQGALRKLYSAVGVVFKGSGFYRTDSRSAESSSVSDSTPAAATKPATSDSPSGTSTSSGTSTAAPATTV